MPQIKLGQRVRDTLSGVEGTAIARTEWLYGCVRITCQPQGVKDGVPFETFTVDEPQVEVLTSDAAPPAQPAHGPREDARRAPDPKR